MPHLPTLQIASRAASRRAAMLLAAVAALLGAVLLAQDGKPTLAAGALFALLAMGLLLWRTRGEAREAARARRELLTSMGHDMRTPLNSVIGFSNVLLRTAAGRLTPQELEYLGRVRANGEQLLHVVDDLLVRGASPTPGADGSGSTPHAARAASPTAGANARHRSPAAAKR